MRSGGVVAGLFIGAPSFTKSRAHALVYDLFVCSADLVDGSTTAPKFCVGDPNHRGDRALLSAALEVLGLIMEGKSRRQCGWSLLGFIASYMRRR